MAELHSQDPSVATSSLYRSVIGSDFDRLPASLRRFHELPTGGRAAGRFEIERGTSLIARSMGWLLGLPRIGMDVPLKLEVVVDGDRERWMRDFDGCCLNSMQWNRNGLLIEKAGLGQFGFRLVADEAGLRFESIRFWFVSIPFPRFLSPRVTASAIAEGEGWRVVMKLSLPWNALLLSYDGIVISE